MENIHKKEDLLFKKWSDKSIELGDGDNLAPDGLLHRGNLECDSQSEPDCYYWGLNEGNEEENWNNASKRLLIITKELNNKDANGKIDEAWDIRVETGLKNGKEDIDYESCICFYKRLRMWSYGLLNMDKDGIYPAFIEARDMENSAPFYMKGPIARINCKKQCGGSSISNSQLKTYLDKYKDLLIENLEIYKDANIILCCAGSGIIKNFIKENYIKDLVQIPNTDDWIYYSPSSDIVVINSWHPSDRRSYKEVYNGMMEAYSYFIKNKYTLNF